MEKSVDPRMHSAEHILNQTMIRMFGCDRCFSAHIEKKKSKCDYRFERPLKPDELREIETRVNRVIQADLPVHASRLNRTEAMERFNLGRLPDGAGDSIRVVQIGDYDACPCIGAHVGSTREIGTFRISSTSFADGVLRLRFKLVPPASEALR